MIVMEPFAKIESEIDTDVVMQKIEHYGRIAWQSEGRMTETSGPAFVRMLIKKGHESVLEHENVSVRFVVDRGVSHELVRHRLASFTQESTRYCNYGRESTELTFIAPIFFPRKHPEMLTAFEDDGTYLCWHRAMADAEHAYRALIRAGRKPEEARTVLPLSLKTELVMTANLREWRHVLRIRTAPDVHPQMRQVMVPLLGQFCDKLPVVFEDLATAK